VPDAEPSSSRNPIKAERPSLAVSVPYTARIAQVEATPVSHDETWLTVTLDIEGSPLTYAPGSTLALWPTNDPEEVRKVLRALGVSAQFQVLTELGAEPAWQVLLERVNITQLSRLTLELLAEYSRSDSEARGLLDLSEADPVQLQTRSLLSVLRRFPSTRPPFERLLSSLAPLEPAFLPVASSFADAQNWLQFSARVVNAPGAWGELGLSAQSRLRVGEWVTVSIDPQHPALPIHDDLAPVVIIAEGACLAFARALAAERRARQAKGRTWVIGIGVPASAFPFARDFVAWHQSGALGRYDIAVGEKPRDALELLEEREDVIWRWLVDHSQICLVTAKPEFRSAIADWLTRLISNRQRVEIESAKTQLNEMRANHRFVQMP